MQSTPGVLERTDLMEEYLDFLRESTCWFASFLFLLFVCFFGLS